VALRDISVTLRIGTPEWPGDTPYDCRWTWRIARGDSVNVSTISGSPHVGTHADAPLHVQDGWPAADQLPLDAFVGPAMVIDVAGAGAVIDLAALALPADQRIEGNDGPSAMHNHVMTPIAVFLCGVALGQETPRADKNSAKQPRSI
jgi:arylformamidase